MLQNLVPTRYAKAIGALVGELVLYLQIYGGTWHLVPAAIMIATGLGVYEVPNSAPTPAPQNLSGGQPVVAAPAEPAPAAPQAATF